MTDSIHVMPDVSSSYMKSYPHSRGCGWPTEYCEFCDRAERWVREQERLDRVRERLEAVVLPVNAYVPHPWDAFWWMVDTGGPRYAF